MLNWDTRNIDFFVFVLSHFILMPYNNKLIQKKWFFYVKLRIIIKKKRLNFVLITPCSKSCCKLVFDNRQVYHCSITFLCDLTKLCKGKQQRNVTIFRRFYGYKTVSSNANLFRANTISACACMRIYLLWSIDASD